MFYSNLKDEINVINQKYENSQRSQIAGLALSSEMDVNSNLKLFINGIWTQGKKNGKSWNEMEHVAEWKANLGINWLTWQDHLNVNLRCNYVGSTLAPTSNTYIWRNHGGKAPAFTKFNLTLTLKKWIGGRVEPQLIVRNLFDEHYFTLGRQDGRSDIVNFNSQSQLASEINPLGFTPAYHPQQGRTVFLNCRYRF
jgi:outer membrane receptor for ferrienterochelin and colicin